MSELLIALAFAAHWLGTVLTYAILGILGALFILGLRQINRSGRLDLPKRGQR